MSRALLEALLAEGVVERVREDLDAARADLIAARAHLDSAEAVAKSDPVGAFGLAYDAMRKSIVAHMRANGLRVKPRDGAHYQTGRYGIAALGGLGIDTELRAFDLVRRTRNQSEYSGASVNEADVSEATAYAWAILNVVERALA